MIESKVEQRMFMGIGLTCPNCPEVATPNPKEMK